MGILRRPISYRVSCQKYRLRIAKIKCSTEHIYKKLGSMRCSRIFRIAPKCFWFFSQRFSRFFRNFISSSFNNYSYFPQINTFRSTFWVYPPNSIFTFWVNWPNFFFIRVEQIFNFVFFYIFIPIHPRNSKNFSIIINRKKLFWPIRRSGVTPSSP